MSDVKFAVMPTISISRSKFTRTCQHKTSFNLGEIVPIYLDQDILPGDTHRIDLASLVRMSNPITPIMDNIYLDIYAFFVPNRILWIHWKEFMGENNSSAGIYSGTEYTTPVVNMYNNGVAVGSIGHHMGLPYCAAGAGTLFHISDLPGRAYTSIYNRWFRDQNLIAPITLNTSDSGNFNYGQACYKAAKFSDYFTRSLPYVQKGSPVSIPLGSVAPLTGTGTVTDTGELKLKQASGIVDFNIKTGAISAGASGNVLLDNDSGSGLLARKLAYGSGLGLDTSTLYADLTNATAATINQLRFAFQYQKLLEKDSIYGTRYWELLSAHFGVTAPDASLQDPQFLGHMRTRINIDQVIQTTGINQATPAQNELGAVAANSVTGDKGNILTFTSTEHGILMIVCVARQDQTYSQGVNRAWTRKKRTDHYFPVFANLGAQPVKNSEIFVTGVTGSSATDDLPFGYQEAWAEYRYLVSTASGLLDPSVPNSLGYWTLTNNFGSLPTLSQSFIEENRSNLVRALATGNNGPDFIADFYFKDIAVRPLPMYSIPGLIDHH